MRNQNLCYHLHHMVAGKMEKHCFTALWSWIDPSGSRPIISLVRQWGALGSGVTCRGKTAQCCRRLAPRGLDKLPGLWTLHLFAWYQMPFGLTSFSLPCRSVIPLGTNHCSCNHCYLFQCPQSLPKSLLTDSVREIQISRKKAQISLFLPRLSA